MTTPDEIDITIDHVAITRLQQAYADLATRRDWPGLVDLFTADCAVDLDLGPRGTKRLVGPGEFADFVGPAVDRFAHFQFVILNSHIELWPEGDRGAATARMYMAEYRQVSAAEGRDDAHGLYTDRYVRTPAGWRFAHRAYRSMARFPTNP